MTLFFLSYGFTHYSPKEEFSISSDRGFGLSCNRRSSQCTNCLSCACAKNGGERLCYRIAPCDFLCRIFSSSAICRKLFLQVSVSKALGHAERASPKTSNSGSFFCCHRIRIVVARVWAGSILYCLDIESDIQWFCCSRLV